jgi:hypothetical protein
LQPSDLCVEVTESVLLSKSAGTEQTIRDLHALGGGVWPSMTLATVTPVWGICGACRSAS